MQSLKRKPTQLRKCINKPEFITFLSFQIIYSCLIVKRILQVVTNLGLQMKDFQLYIHIKRLLDEFGSNHLTKTVPRMEGRT